MEVLNPLSFLLVFILAMVLIGWFLLNPFRFLLLEKTDDRSMLLLQQQVDQLRTQVGQVLDNSAQLIQRQLSQLLGHVNERRRENAEVLHKTQRTLDERLNNAARVVGSVQRSLGGTRRGQPQDLRGR